MLPFTRATRLAMPLVAVALLASACGGDDAGVEVDDAWARPSPSMASAGAVYMNITSDDADRLVTAGVEDGIAGTVEIHETVAADMSEGGESEEGEGMGAMMMQEIGEIALPAGETVSLAPGGLHIMLLDLAAPLETGDTLEVTLEFENAPPMTVEVEVRTEAP